MPTPNNQPRIVDLRVPLPFLITGVVSIALFMAGLGWNASAQSGKLDTLIAANMKLEKRFDDRDIRLDAMRERMYASDRVTDTLSLRVTALEGRRK